jgi:DNA-binding NarL/FixJ family response regulator
VLRRVREACGCTCGPAEQDDAGDERPETDGLAALDATETLRPDVVFMDIRMPNLNGIEATRRIAAGDRAPRILILTTFDLDDYVYEALRAGASGFLLKDARADELRQAVQIVASGDALLSPAITRRLIESYTRRPPPTLHPAPLAELTPRELEVLRLVARGLSNAEIARELIVGDATIKTHVRTHLLQAGPPRPCPSRRPRLRKRTHPTRRSPRPNLTQRLTQRRRGHRTMNGQACAHTLDQSHRLVERL